MLAQFIYKRPINFCAEFIGFGIVGVVGFEPTQPYGNRLWLEECMILRYFQPISNHRFLTVYSVITVCPASPTAAHSHKKQGTFNVLRRVGFEPTKLKIQKFQLLSIFNLAVCPLIYCNPAGTRTQDSYIKCWHQDSNLDWPHCFHNRPTYNWRTPSSSSIWLFLISWRRYANSLSYQHTIFIDNRELISVVLYQLSYEVIKIQ